MHGELESCAAGCLLRGSCTQRKCGEGASMNFFCLPFICSVASVAFVWSFCCCTAAASLQEAEQVHVSLAGPSKIRVSWVTYDVSAISRVEYGTAPGLYDSYADGSSDSYRIFFYKSGLIHNVVLGPLEAATVYYYRCGGGNTEYNFKTPPFVGSGTPITFAIAGDLGQTEWTSSTLSHIQQSDYDVLILPGDLSYADYYQPLWDSFGRLVEPLASLRPWMVTQGNHEMDLAKVDRTRTPWLIAIIHAPWYSSNTKHQGDGEAMRQSMESILKEAKVDVLFAGHVHAYERTAKIFNLTTDDCGFYHFTIGDGGNREGLARTFQDPKPNWSIYREASYGFGLLQLLNSTHAYWKWHRNQDNSTAIGDELWITKALEPAGPCGTVTIG